MTAKDPEKSVIVGRRICRWIAVLIVLVDLVRNARDVLFSGYLTWIQIGSFALLIALAIALWFGKNWARWMIGVGCVLLTAVNIGTLGLYWEEARIYASFNIAFGLLYASASYFLIVDKTVEAFCHRSLKS